MVRYRAPLESSSLDAPAAMSTLPYQPQRPSQSRFVDVRGLRYHVRHWGAGLSDAPLVMLHGWMDVSASFQFMVDAFERERAVLAPDWRGFGLSACGPGDCYWFPDYIADLDALLDALFGPAPVTLVGHSMGGNVALLYAGIRPQRVRAVINLEGFGLKDNPPQRAPDRYAEWLDELKRPPSGRDYASLEEIAARLRKTNPRLPADKAAFLAPHWSWPHEGAFRIAGDPAHRIVNPVLYRWPEVEACWRRVTAPVLWVEGADTDAHKWAGDAEELARRRAVLPAHRFARIDAAGHMLHHDRPQATAHLVEAFLRDIED
jgi:pimeloyl-ACP methyl ester carboxylesterase